MGDTADKTQQDGDQHEGHLGAVYAASSPEEVAKRYDAWAETYDGYMASAGYRHPSVCLALLTRHLPKGEGPVLDAGAGTGLVGEWLGIVGYPQAVALDLSEGMLAVAARKGVYASLHRAALGGPLPFTDGEFAAVVSTGVFTTGHVGGEALDELARVTRPGGVMAITVKDTVWDGGFSAKVAEMQAAGVLRLIEETAPYVSMPGEEGTSPGRGIVLQLAG
ncbi:class I SAM-dependent DNA methyltransferase [Frigidibacter sp. ROC022]|uniref:class I SAM-dependent DNA methyltransferase n=1 Tax=Frigidibacter sp. ROC022 TaxID=2971796 RepID=UPI00215B397F|nr:class I SAM-dependent methyltransferase [Frigidibacter sp. ROC022]MCR8726170.1 class I SAM-dependent methyltransferase [Frigidibacter sp. ROC022]